MRRGGGGVTFLSFFLCQGERVPARDEVLPRRGAYKLILKSKRHVICGAEDRGHSLKARQAVRLEFSHSWIKMDTTLRTRSWGIRLVPSFLLASARDLELFLQADASRPSGLVRSCGTPPT